uniref:Uncharacterized protein n=1 Tax=Musa acuminata subsp. malaccensis TaxID=214687 RepID=A0A804L818_MUSAM
MRVPRCRMRHRLWWPRGHLPRGSEGCVSSVAAAPGRRPATSLQLPSSGMNWSKGT